MADVEIRFTPPVQLLNMNQRLHWTVQRRLAREWRSAACWAATAIATSPRWRRQPPCFVFVELPVADRRRRDPANYAPTVKHIVDGLVDAGCWPDDTPEWVTTTEPTLRVGGELVVVRLHHRQEPRHG